MLRLRKARLITAEDLGLEVQKGGPLCGAKRTNKDGETFLCTRKAGHESPHWEDFCRYPSIRERLIIRTEWCD